MTTYLQADDTAPFAIKIKSLVDVGYAQTTVCYKCTNGVATKTVTINVRQKYDCTIALSTLAASNLADQTFEYSEANAGLETLPYADSTTIMTNPQSGDCGAIKSCSFKAQGCVNAYSGKLTIQILSVPNLTIKAESNVTPGYTETLCVVCENNAGS